MTNCIICDKIFREGELLQAFLRCPEDPEGSWTKPIIVDSKFQERSELHKDKVKRKHYSCISELSGEFDGVDSPLKELERRRNKNG